MKTLEIEAAIQAFSAAGADRGVLYLSTPITTGLYEYELMDELGLERTDLRAKRQDDWLMHVVAANETDAAQQADRLTETWALGRLVINPARVKFSTWSQDEYDVLWSRLLKEFPTTVVPLPGWAYSRGARLEISLAVELGLAVLGLDGGRLTHDALLREVQRADNEIEERGWLRFAPPLPRVLLSPDSTLSPQSGAETPDEAYARQVFVWLVRERGYQLKKFGTQLDDEHTEASGLQADGWWSHQLQMYYHRAGVLGLEHLNGRQALAKYVATACGLLESVVRVHGWLPAPGLTSGNVVREDAGHGKPIQAPDVRPRAAG